MGRQRRVVPEAEFDVKNVVAKHISLYMNEIGEPNGAA